VVRRRCKPKAVRFENRSDGEFVLKSKRHIGVAVAAVLSLVVLLVHHGQGDGRTVAARSGLKNAQSLKCLHDTFYCITSETIRGRQTAVNRFAWSYGYDVGLEHSALIVKVGINLIPAQGIGRLDLDRVKTAWEEGIERIWSERFALATGEGRRYPILVDVSFQGPRFHHDVIIRPGSGRTDEFNWNILDSPELVSHEFGHMMGIYDEYEKGALPLHDAVIDAGSIMTSNPGRAAVPRARHYEPFRQWFMGKAMASNVRIIDENEKRE
jgi:hypothetical protein